MHVHCGIGSQMRWVVAAPFRFLLHENLVQVWGNSINGFMRSLVFFLFSLFSVDAWTTNHILAVHWTSLVLIILPQNDQRRHYYCTPFSSRPQGSLRRKVNNGVVQTKGGKLRYSSLSDTLVGILERVTVSLCKINGLETTVEFGVSRQ